MLFLQFTQNLFFNSKLWRQIPTGNPWNLSAKLIYPTSQIQ